MPAHRRNVRLVPCERIRVAGAERRCVSHGQDVYLVGGVDDDERTALELVAEALDLGLGHSAIEAILQRRTPAEIEQRRAAVRRYKTDAERLVAAVGEQDSAYGSPSLTPRRAGRWPRVADGDGDSGGAHPPGAARAGPDRGGDRSCAEDGQSRTPGGGLRQRALDRQGADAGRDAQEPDRSTSRSTR